MKITSVAATVLTTLLGVTILGDLGTTNPTHASSETVYLDNIDRLMPAFFHEDIQNGLSGSINLKVSYNKGKVSSVSVLATDLKTRTDYATRYPGLVELSRDRIVGTVREWKSYIVSPFDTEVTIELGIDKSLPASARQYRFELGRFAAMTKLVLSGPDLTRG